MGRRCGNNGDRPGRPRAAPTLGDPPAWTDVWATLDASASVQATGVDGRGRTQYRYAPDALALAADMKFDQMLAFAAALPALRKTVVDDLTEGHHD